MVTWKLNYDSLVDWADLATLDLSKFDQPGGKSVLAKQLFEAIQKIGMYQLIYDFGSLSIYRLQDSFTSSTLVYHKKMSTVNSQLARSFSSYR